MTKRLVNQLGGEDYAVEDLEGTNTGTGVVDTVNLAYNVSILGQQVVGDDAKFARGTAFSISRSLGLSGVPSNTPIGYVFWRPPQNSTLMVIHSIHIEPTSGLVSSDTTVGDAGAQSVSICMMRSSDQMDFYDFCACSVPNGDWFVGSGNLLYSPGPTSNVGTTNGFGPRGVAGSGSAKSSPTIGGGPNGPWHCAFPSQEVSLAGIADCMGFVVLSTGSAPLDNFAFDVHVSGTYYLPG